MDLPFNLLTALCFGSIPFLIGMAPGKDAKGRGFLGRLDAGALTESDKFGVKLICGVFIAGMIFWAILG